MKICNAKEMKKLYNLAMYIFKLCTRTNGSRSDWQKKAGIIMIKIGIKCAKDFCKQKVIHGTQSTMRKMYNAAM